MYPDIKEMDFECTCAILQRKNVWSDVTGVHVRYCPMCGERRASYYEPSLRWEETGRGGEPMPPYMVSALAKAELERAKMRAAHKVVPAAK